MAEPTQFSFSLKELASVLVREQGITEGRWSVGFEFSVTIGTIGPNPSEARPGGLMQILSVNLEKADDAPEDASTVVNAAEVRRLSPRTRKAGGPKKQ